MSLIADLIPLLGASNVLTGPDMDRYERDWMGNYHGTPLAVARPGSTAEVAATVQLAARHKAAQDAGGLFIPPPPAAGFGITDPDDNPLTLRVTAITQDEPMLDAVAMAMCGQVGPALLIEYTAPAAVVVGRQRRQRGQR